MTTLQFDPKLPEQLKKNQVWFGSIITRPIDGDSNMNPVAPSGRLMEIEAKQYIKPGPKLRSHQRIEIYNQQYWWRLLSTLHEIFPLLTRLFGYYQFNMALAMPYLVKYPPNDWALNKLGDRLPQWIMEEYHERDKQFVLDAAKLDFAYSDAFLKPGFIPLTTDKLPNADDLSSLLEQSLTLQPYIHLFGLPYELFSFRTVMIKEDGDYWIDHDFPELKKGKFFTALFRTRENDIGCEPLIGAEYLLLKQFQKGASISEACDSLENHDFDEQELDIAKWFQKWVARGWLSPKY